MSIKAKRYLFTSLLMVLLFLTCGGMLYAFRPVVKESPTPGPSEIALHDALSRHKKGEIPFVDLSTITTFSWDRVYVFGPYTEYSEIRAVAGSSWRDSCFTTIELSDGISLLVFTDGHRMVGCIEYPQNQANFELLADYKEGFSIEQARFILDESGGVVWIGDQ